MLCAFLFFMMMSTEVNASETTIQGSAQTADGKRVEYQMVLPSNDTYAPYPNVVRNEPEEPQSAPASNPAVQNENNHELIQWSEQNPKPFSISPQKEQNEIENTLYEGGDRIYDVQSYPINDIKTITEPNIDPTITNYPSY